MKLTLACYILLKRLFCVGYEKQNFKIDSYSFVSTFFLNAVATSKWSKKFYFYQCLLLGISPVSSYRNMSGHSSCNINWIFTLTILTKRTLGASYCIYAITARVQFFIEALFSILYFIYVSRHKNKIVMFVKSKRIRKFMLKLYLYWNMNY